MFDPKELEAFFGQTTITPDKEVLRVSTDAARELKEKMVFLRDHPAFQELQRALQKQMSARLSTNLQMPNGLDGMTQILYCNGEIAGLKLAHDFVNILIDSCSDTIKMNDQLIADYPDEQEQENGQE